MNDNQPLTPEVLHHLLRSGTSQTDVAKAFGVTRQRVGQLASNAENPLRHHLVVVGGQFGSEGKGRVVEWLLQQRRWDASVRVGGPQAGHTVDDSRTAASSQGTYAFRQLPVSVASPEADRMVHIIGRAATIDLEVLHQEVKDWGGGIPILLDQNATIVEPRHRLMESHPDTGEASLVERIGSTGKGVGAARSDRIWRQAMRVADLDWGDLPPVEITDTRPRIAHLWEHGKILFEGAQGLGLSLNSRYYPKVTSSDCTSAQLLSDVGISAAQVRDRLHHTLGVYRTYPIRVAGDSGYLYAETTWEELGVRPETTTVTKKTRRVGGWDSELAAWSTRYGGVDLAALTFLDYLPEKGRDAFLTEAEKDLGVPIWLTSTGPGKIDIR